MIDTKVVGTFKATTFDGERLEFVVKSDGIHCDFLDEIHGEKLPPIKALYLKPNFEFSLSGTYSSRTNKKFRTSDSNQSLIKSFEINEDLLNVMGEAKLVTYSMEMAEFYNLSPRFCYDRGKRRHYELGQSEGRIKRKRYFNKVKRTGNFD